MDDVTSKEWNRQDITERLITKIHDVISPQYNALVKEDDVTFIQKYLYMEAM